MKKVSSLIVIAACAAMVFSFSACRKIQEDVFIKGVWRVNEMYLDTLTGNQMPVHFDGFITGSSCCIYKLDFQNDDVVFGYYITNNTFQSVVIGTWEIVKYNQIELHVDSFANGVFNIKKVNVRNYELTSDKNDVKYFDGIAGKDSVYTKLYIERI
jgi:hypothetical protein